MAKLIYTHEELLAERPYASRIRWRDKLFHGGLDAHGVYIPPRSAQRIEAIANWTEQLRAAGQPAQVIDPAGLDLQFFPNVAQSKLLLRNGASGAMTRILTLIGITEGFGNDGLRMVPRPALAPLFKESIEGTCLDHLYRGLFEAHGNDEAGSGDEAGHDGMWYAIRDAALQNPTITPDMFENLPIAPPPGYSGPAKAAPEAIGTGQMIIEFANIDTVLEVLLMILTQLLVIELVAYGTFAWAQEVLSDSECSAAPEFAPRMVDYIRQDENLHVGYLQCALAEIRCRTLKASDGNEIPGQTVIDRICEGSLQNNRQPARRERLLRYRMQQIQAELLGHRDGARLLARFAELGPTPALAA
jgi:hypothetical protein